MKQHDILTRIQEFKYDELSPELQQLVKSAREATYRSYSPYSHFRVGAAISLSDGSVVCGANQENVAYPSGTCAERTAAFYAHASHPDAKFTAIAIAARDTSGQFVSQPISPCGACRQVLVEYERLAGHPVPVYLIAADKVYRLDSVTALLPLAFVEF